MAYMIIPRNNHHPIVIMYDNYGPSLVMNHHMAVVMTISSIDVKIMASIPMMNPEAKEYTQETFTSSYQVQHRVCLPKQKDVTLILSH
jgi:hypothetical protein